jgi:hypothetical protein
LMMPCVTLTFWSLIREQMHLALLPTSPTRLWLRRKIPVILNTTSVNLESMMSGPKSTKTTLINQWWNSMKMKPSIQISWAIVSITDSAPTKEIKPMLLIKKGIALRVLPRLLRRNLNDIQAAKEIRNHTRFILTV